MNGDILDYFNRELNYLRPLQAEFAEGNPKIAERLRISADTIEDPHVRRLIDAFAFLTARIHRKIDDEFPELTDSLLEVLYPHYLAPIPSMAILQLAPRPDLSSPYQVPSGSIVEAEAPGGERCRFQTRYPVTLWPITIDQAMLAGRPLQAPVNPFAANAAAVLRLSLRCLAPDMTFGTLQPDRLRFFIRAQPQIALPLYELLMSGVTSLALADGANDPDPVILGTERIEAVGFGPDEGMLPYRARSFPGYRLVTEYFAFPEKFLFFDITGMSAKTLRDGGNRLELFIYLDRSSVELERAVSAESFALGCTPLVNLFEQRAEPIRLTHHLPEYRVVPDTRRQGGLEVYSITAVTATSPTGDIYPYTPFFMPQHGTASDQPRYWNSVRRPGGERNPGSEVYLTLVDLDFDPAVEQDWTVSVETICLNRDLPARIPFGGVHSRVEMVDGAAEVLSAQFLTAPTRTLRPPLGPGARWRLLSHLSLNHLSLTAGPEPLREILRLYDFRDSAETRAVIDGLLSLDAKPGTARVAGAITAVCRGLDVTVELADRLGATGTGYLFAAVLERFLGLYVNVNAFTRLTARIEGRVGVLKRWPARAGDRVLL